MRWNKGYTLVEVMMFLAISSGFLLIAMAGVSQRQRNTEFTSEMREVEHKIKTIFSDVKNGYFDNPQDWKCSVSGGPLSVNIVNSPGSRLGENSECIFLGKVIVFGDSVSEDDRAAFRIYTIVGARPGVNSSVLLGAEVKDAKPTVVDVADITLESSMKYGVVVSNRTDARYSNMIGAINGLSMSNQEPRTFALGTIWGDVSQISALQNPNNYESTAGFSLDSTNGEIICFEAKGDSSKVAQIRIGRNGQQFTTELEYRDCEV